MPRSSSSLHCFVAFATPVVKIKCFLSEKMKYFLLPQNESSFAFPYFRGENKCVPICYCQVDYFPWSGFYVRSPSRNPLFTQPCSMSLSDQLLPARLQNKGLSLNMCPEPLHARGEGTVAVCTLLNSVQCKAVFTSVQTLSVVERG